MSFKSKRFYCTVSNAPYKHTLAMAVEPSTPNNADDARLAVVMINYVMSLVKDELTFKCDWLDKLVVDRVQLISLHTSMTCVVSI